MKEKRRKQIIIGIIILLIILTLIPVVYTFVIAVNNMINGFAFNFRGNISYGMSAFIKTFLLYIWIGWPIIIMQIILFIITIVLLIYLRRKKNMKEG